MKPPKPADIIAQIAEMNERLRKLEISRRRTKTTRAGHVISSGNNTAEHGDEYPQRRELLFGPQFTVSDVPGEDATVVEVVPGGDGTEKPAVYNETESEQTLVALPSQYTNIIVRGANVDATLEGGAVVINVANASGGAGNGGVRTERFDYAKGFWVNGGALVREFTLTLPEPAFVKFGINAGVVAADPNGTAPQTVDFRLDATGPAPELDALPPDYVPYNKREPSDSWRAGVVSFNTTDETALYGRKQRHKAFRIWQTNGTDDELWAPGTYQLQLGVGSLAPGSGSYSAGTVFARIIPV